MKTIEPSIYVSSFNVGTFKNDSWSELPLLPYVNVSDWGPKRDPLFIVVPFTILFATIFLIGLIGNISTCIVIAHNKSMHTATNYYLFSLAISDLLLLISGLPQEMYNIWSKYPYIFGEAFCVLQGFAAETSANATVLTITAFTVERYIAICHPFLSHTMSTLSRAIKLILLIWMFAICLAIPQAISFGIVYETVPDNVAINEEHNTCNVKRIVIPHAFLISTVLFFVTPMTLITILYILIGLQLRQSSVGPVRGGSIKLNHLVYKRTLVTHTNSTQLPTFVMKENGTTDLQLSSPEDSRTNCLTPTSQTSTKHVVKMLVAVVVAFFICWAPFHAQRLLAIYGQSSSSDMVATFTALTYISGVLYYLSTTINPLLYHIMSHKFRLAFKETFTTCLYKKQDSSFFLRYATVSARTSLENGNPIKETTFFKLTSGGSLRTHFKFKKKPYKNRNGVVYINSSVMKDSQRKKYVPYSQNEAQARSQHTNLSVHKSVAIKGGPIDNNRIKGKGISGEWINNPSTAIETQHIMQKRCNSCNLVISNEQSDIDLLPKSLTMPNVNACDFRPS
ncbi:hypothetical protein RI129_000594 [Pyrocoelia pectoralis]|uniref:G-protein coupled receptors family 1 profile domain-containing protein n=1 Tax=Pyrocoelia pectoralis TaxID=417401 RepID=A0AAN7ZJE9_9COLE